MFADGTCYWALGFETQRMLLGIGVKTQRMLLGIGVWNPTAAAAPTLESSRAGTGRLQGQRKGQEAMEDFGLGQQSTLFQERNDTQWRVMGARDYQEATCGRLLMKRVESGLKKEWEKKKTLHSKETKKKKEKNWKCFEERSLRGKILKLLWPISQHFHSQYENFFKFFHSADFDKNRIFRSRKK